MLNREQLEELVHHANSALRILSTALGEELAKQRAEHFRENAHVLFPELRRDMITGEYTHNKTGKLVQFTQYGYVEVE